MGNNIKPHLEHAEKTGVCNLAKLELAELPEGIQRLSKNLRTLDVSDNKLTNLPPCIGTFSQLKSLNASKNRLSILLPEIGNLQKLEVLLLAENRLTAVPSTFANLRSLRTVSLCSNHLKTFPVALCGLKNLNTLDLSRNKLSEVPDDVRGLSIVELNLNQNQLSRLSEAIAECPQLKVLRLEENCLELTAFTPKILRDSSVSLLAVDGNVFDQKNFQRLEGYEQYMERYTATKKKNDVRIVPDILRSRTEIFYFSETNNLSEVFPTDHFNTKYDLYDLQISGSS